VIRSRDLLHCNSPLHQRS